MLILRLFNTLAICFFLSPSIFSQCQFNVQAASDDQCGYKWRGNRYEGTITKKLSSPQLEIVGLTRGEFAFTADEGEVIQVIVDNSNLDSNQICVQAVAIPGDLHYLMHSDLNPNDTLHWSKDACIDHNKRLQDPTNIGLCGIITQSGKSAPFYTPLRIISPSADDELFLVLVANVTIAQIKWRSDLLEVYQIKKVKIRAYNPIVIPFKAEKAKEFTLEVKMREYNSIEWLTKSIKIKT